MKQKTLLSISPYSAPSSCGIWVRVFRDLKSLDSNKLKIFSISSNILKGTNTKLDFSDSLNGITIYRFKVLFKLGDNALFFFFFKKLLKLRPDIIHTHGYRHPHSLQALIVGKLLRKKVILTAHGPFKKDPSRPLIIKLFDFFYDLFIGWWELRLYDRIIYIAGWEKPFLKRRGAPEKKLIYIPNSISEEYTNSIPEKIVTKSNSCLYMGRIDPVKRLDWIEYCAKKLSETNFTLVGPDQMNYAKKVTPPNLVKELHKYDSAEFISNAKKHKLFLLPSIRESFSLVAVEAMSQGLIVISSNTMGVNEYIINGENGFIVNSKEEMLSQIQYVLNLPIEEQQRISENAIETAKKYSSERIAQDYRKLITDLLK